MLRAMRENSEGNWVRAPVEELVKTHPHLAEFLPFLDAFNSESPRGGVLVAASFIDRLLSQVLESFLIEGKSQKQLLHGFNAPVGNFSSRIALAAALGLISEDERQECDTIRKIRNEFAHQIHPSFETSRVSKLCDQLAYSARPINQSEVKAIGLFKSASVALIANLVNRPHYVSRERIIPRRWKL